MRRHVHEVPGAGHEAAQPVGGAAARPGFWLASTAWM